MLKEEDGGKKRFKARLVVKVFAVGMPKWEEFF